MICITGQRRLKEAEQIVKMDPNVQIGHILVGVHSLLTIDLGVFPDPIIRFAKATEAAQKALSLDKDNSDVHIWCCQLFCVKFFSSNILKKGRFLATFPIGFDLQYISILRQMKARSV